MMMNRIGLLGHCSLGLHARLRALGYGPNRRWPRVIQACVCVIAAGSLIACAARNETTPLAVDEPSEVLDEKIPQILLTFTLIESHRRGDEGPTDQNEDRLLTQAEYAAFLTALTDDGAHVLTNPRLLVLDGHEAWISIGDSDRGEEFFRFDVTPRTMPQGELNADGQERKNAAQNDGILLDFTLNARPDASYDPYEHTRRDFYLPPDRIAVFMVSNGIDASDAPVHFLALEAKILGPGAEISSR